MRSFASATARRERSRAIPQGSRDAARRGFARLGLQVCVSAPACRIRERYFGCHIDGLRLAIVKLERASLKLLRRKMLNCLRDMRVRGRTWSDRLGAIDWPIARALALGQDRRMPLAAANVVSRLGNGPIYLLIVGAVILFHPHEAMTIILCAAASILLLHCIYPSMKRATARPRPRDVEAAFPDSIPTLDKYSFPSGHVMTLSAALTPIFTSRREPGLSVWRSGPRWPGRDWRWAITTPPTSRRERSWARSFPGFSLIGSCRRRARDRCGSASSSD